MKKLGKKTLAAIIAGAMVFTSFAVSAVGEQHGNVVTTEATGPSDGNSFYEGTVTYTTTKEGQSSTVSGVGDFSQWDSTTNGTKTTGYLGVFDKNDTSNPPTPVTGFAELGTTDVLIDSPSAGSYKFMSDPDGAIGVKLTNRTASVNIAGLPDGEYYLMWYVKAGAIKDTNLNDSTQQELLKSTNTFKIINPVDCNAPTVSKAIIGANYEITYTVPTGLKADIDLMKGGSSVASKTGATGNGTFTTTVAAAEGDTVKAKITLVDSNGNMVPITGVAPLNYKESAEVSPTYAAPANAPTVKTVNGKESIDGTFYAKKGGSSYSIVLDSTANAEPPTLPPRKITIGSQSFTSATDTVATTSAFNADAGTYTIQATYDVAGAPTPSTATLILLDKPTVTVNADVSPDKVVMSGAAGATISGTATNFVPGDEVKVTFADGPANARTATVNASGIWSMTVSPYDPAKLGSATAELTNGLGDTASATFEIINATVADIVIDSDDTELEETSPGSKEFNTTKDGTSAQKIKIKVTAPVGTNYKVTIQRASVEGDPVELVSERTGTGSADSFDIWHSLGLPSGGTYIIEAKYTNANGKSDKITVNVITAASLEITVSPAEYDAEANKKVTGTATPKSEVSIYLADGTKIAGPVETGADGKWSITLDLNNSAYVGTDKIYAQASYKGEDSAKANIKVNGATISGTPLIVNVNGNVKSETDGKFYVKAGDTSYKVKLDNNGNSGVLPAKYVSYGGNNYYADSNDIADITSAFPAGEGEYNVVAMFDMEGALASPVAKIVIQDKPKVNVEGSPITMTSTGGAKITGTATGADGTTKVVDGKVTVTFKDNRSLEATVDKDGKWEITIASYDGAKVGTAKAKVESPYTGLVSDETTFEIVEREAGDIEIVNGDDTVVEIGTNEYNTFHTAASDDPIPLKIKADTGEEYKLTVGSQEFSPFMGTGALAPVDFTLGAGSLSGNNTMKAEYTKADGKVTEITLHILPKSALDVTLDPADYEPITTTVAGKDAIPGSTIELYKAGETTPFATTTAKADGKWEIANVNLTGLEGTDTVYAVSKYAGETSDNPAYLNIGFDTPAAAPEILKVNGKEKSPTTGFFYAAAGGDSYEVELGDGTNGGTLPGKYVTVDADLSNTKYPASSNISVVTSTFLGGAGTYELTAAYDVAGSQEATATLILQGTPALTVDQAPKATMTTAGGLVLSGTSDAIDGTVEIKFANSLIIEAKVDGTGKWITDPSPIDYNDALKGVAKVTVSNPYTGLSTVTPVEVEIVPAEVAAIKIDAQVDESLVKVGEKEYDTFRKAGSAAEAILVRVNAAAPEDYNVTIVDPNTNIASWNAWKTAQGTGDFANVDDAVYRMGGVNPGTYWVAAWYDTANGGDPDHIVVNILDINDLTVTVDPPKYEAKAGTAITGTAGLKKGTVDILDGDGVVIATATVGIDGKWSVTVDLNNDAYLGKKLTAVAKYADKESAPAKIEVAYTTPGDAPLIKSITVTEGVNTKVYNFDGKTLEEGGVMASDRNYYIPYDRNAAPEYKVTLGDPDGVTAPYPDKVLNIKSGSKDSNVDYISTNEKTLDSGVMPNGEGEMVLTAKYVVGDKVSESVKVILQGKPELKVDQGSEAAVPTTGLTLSGTLKSKDTPNTPVVDGEVTITLPSGKEITATVGDDGTWTTGNIPFADFCDSNDQC